MDFVVTILYLWLTLFLQYGAPMRFPRKFQSSKLVGGGVLSIDEFPYIVSIQKYQESLWEYGDSRKVLYHSCAGVIISEYWVLTAANCLQHKNPEETEVFKGNSIGLHIGSYHQVDKIIVHPNYKPTRAAYPPNNIAVLHVKKSLFRNDTNVSAIALGRIPDESGIGVQTVGWSSTGDLGVFSRREYYNLFEIRLRELSLQTMDSEHCSKRGNKLVDKEICVFGRPGKTWCSIDAGNPLITTKNTRLVGIGINPRHSCNGDLPDLPALFLRLSVYVDWLRNVTGLQLSLD